MDIFVKPKEGLKIKRPDTNRFLAPEGEDVPNSTFWQRRLTDGDVVLLAEKKPEQKKPAEKPLEKSSDKGGGAK